MADDTLKAIRQSRMRLAQMERAQNAEYRVRKRLFEKARKEGVPLRLVAHAAGISEGAVSLAMRANRDVPMRDEQKQ